jgi:beta-lactamase class A
MTLHRRVLLALPALGLLPRPAVAQTLDTTGNAAGDTTAIDAALARFAALPGSTSYVIEAERTPSPWRAEHMPLVPMFVGSAIKTFILATFLREMEAGRLSEDEQLPIDDDIRSLSSPVFLHLTGTTPARSVLEAMITHSDNTATDVALHRVGVERVRAFIATAGLDGVLISDSTRRLFSYLAGAAPGADLGWAGMQQVMADKLPGPARSPINDQQSMICSAATFVAYYQQALQGRYFTKPATLGEFKRIQAMADAIALVVPPDTVAYAKGGSIDWRDFHALCVPGQMIPGRRPVTFCFTLNWTGPDAGVADAMQGFKDSVAGVLAAVATTFG